MYEKFLKRFFDILLAVFGIVVLSLVFITVAILVRKKLGTPVIFKQVRPGKDEKLFTLYKFRTMTDERSADGNLLSDELRLTKFGKKLRETSLDELPEFFNILKGEMSFVGPRPLLKEYLPLYTEEQRKRHTVRPGLTGLAQVNGRNTLSWEQKFQYDVAYVEHITFMGDIKILLKTVKNVVKRKGISSATHVTMENFTGGKLS